MDEPWTGDDFFQRDEQAGDWFIRDRPGMGFAHSVYRAEVAAVLQTEPAPPKPPYWASKDADPYATIVPDDWLDEEG